MIQVNELKVGNWVNLIALDQKIQIKSVNKTEVGGLYTWVHDGEEYEDSLTGIEGIPLSAEILEKAGLICLNYGTHKKYITGEFCITQYPNDEFTFMWNGQVVYIKWVHQLQNLYYPLMGEELDIKL